MRVFLFLFFLMQITASAQRPCGTQHTAPELKTTAPSTLEILSSITGSSSQSGVTAPFIVRIPVVVHVLYNTSSQNISDEQIKSQITALNRDFRRQNSDTVNTPLRFKHLAADVQIEFYLATADPNGRATTGIVRKQTNINEWVMDDAIKFSKSGGDDAWDSRYYLNFWVGNMRRLLGYATSPGGEAARDGIVMSPRAFGTINTSAPYHLGRTAVHETGHWLGLRHIWGDSFCGDDGVHDTPKQGNYTPGCPNNFRSSCSNGEQGDMYMNYMDFTDDGCVNMFTHGQAQLMRSHLTGTRSSLLSSRGLQQPWNTEAPIALPDTKEPTTITAKATLYPNPASSVLNINLDVMEEGNTTTAQLFNNNGLLLQTLRLTSARTTLPIKHLSDGIYYLKISSSGRLQTIRFVKH